MLLREPQMLRPLLGLSTLAGMRSISPLAVLSYALSRRSSPNDSPIVQRFGSKEAATALALLAAAELIGDKLPFTPARTSDPAFLGRLISGSATGALLRMTYKQPVLEGAIQGGIVAALSTYGSYHLRRTLGSLLGLPEPLPGVIEDVVVLLVAKQLLTWLEENESSQMPQLTTTDEL